MKKQLLTLAAVLLCTLGTRAQSSAYTFIHLSDIHVSTVSSAVNSCDVNGAKAQCYLDYFAHMAPKPLYVLGTGDISNIGNSTAVPGGMYTALTQYLYPHNLLYPGVGDLYVDSAKTIPIYLAPGNHEYYTSLTSFSFSTQTLPYVDSLPNFVKYIGPDSDYAVSTPISVTLFMRSGHDISYLTSTDPKGSGYATSQIDWMRSELMQNQSKRKIIVMHHPPSDAAGYSCGHATFSGNGNDSSASFVDHRLGFIHLCDSFHVDLVLAGHVHQNVVVDKHGHVIDENCDTCGTRYVQTGPAFAGCYRVISVDSSFITVSRPMLSCDSSATTGMPDLPRELELSVYPEPSNGLFNVSLGQSMPVDIRVYNMLGETVYHQRSDDLVHQVDLRSQPDGMYLLQIISDHDGLPVVYTLKYPLIVSK